MQIFCFKMCWRRELERINRNHHELYLENFIPVWGLAFQQSEVVALKELMKVEVQLTADILQEMLNLTLEEKYQLSWQQWNLQQIRDRASYIPRNFISEDSWEDSFDTDLLRHMILQTHAQFQAERAFIYNLVAIIPQTSAVKASAMQLCRNRDAVQSVQPQFTYFSMVTPQIED